MTTALEAASPPPTSMIGRLIGACALEFDISRVYAQVISSSGKPDPSGVYDIAQGGYTPLLFVARQGDLESARLVVAAGADVNDAARWVPARLWSPPTAATQRLPPSC